MGIFINPKHRTLFKTDWVEVKESDSGFQYLQRKGKNSIAILPYNSKTKEVLVRFQPMCAVEELGDMENRLSPCPITGSIDDSDTSTVGTVLRELKEETGYTTDTDNIEFISKVIPSTQTNEIIYQYIVDVVDLPFSDAQGDGSIHKRVSKNVWYPITEVYDLDLPMSSLVTLLDAVSLKLYYGSLDELREELDKTMSFKEIVKELIDTWKRSGEIHNDKVDSKKEAIKKAVAIAYHTKYPNI